MMANEYIKRDTAYNYLTEYYNHRTDIQHQNLRKALNAIPSADVMPVVRCKDCCYGEVTDHDFPTQYRCNSTGCTWHEEDFFCADGERRDGGT